MTNHSSLKWLQQHKDPEGLIARWALRLQGYNFTVLHGPGIQHQNADGLSRMPILALHPAEADRLYELIGYPDAWEHEPETTRLALSSLSKDTVVRDGQLFKKVGDLFLPYVALAYVLPLFSKPTKILDMEELPKHMTGWLRPTIGKVCGFSFLMSLILVMNASSNVPELPP